MNLRPSLALAIIALPALTSLSPARAAELSWSGFGTAGYAISDQPYSYERFVSNRGTFKRDSILGLQMDAKVDAQWAATVQATVAPSTSNDDRWEPTLTWAFLSYRPSNDLLLRAGKMRMPMYLFSENMNIGASYDMAHLPTDVYSTAPTADFSGASFSKNWAFPAGELSLDGYGGVTQVKVRVEADDSASQSASTLHTRSAGLVATWHQEENTYRFGVQQAYIKAGDNASASLGLTQVSRIQPATAAIPFDHDTSQGSQNTTQGSQGGQADELSTQIYLLGVDHTFGNGLRLISEYVRRHTRDANIGKNTRGGYLSALKRIGPWTPYLTYSRLLSDKDAREAASTSSSGTTSNSYDDQYSWALGASYALSPTTKIKGEWMRVHIGSMSTLVDTPTGSSPVSNQNINVFSLSYNIVF